MMSENHESHQWKLLHKTTNRIEASIIQGNLESAGIPCVIMNKQDSSYLAFGLIEVLVPESFMESAQAILTQTENNTD